MSLADLLSGDDEPPLVQTPYGQVRHPTMSEIQYRQHTGRGFTRAEMWLIERELEVGRGIPYIEAGERATRHVEEAFADRSAEANPSE